MYELQTEQARLLIDEKMGGRANLWQIADLQVLKPMVDQAVIGGWYAMAPWAGRISNNKIDFQGKSYLQEKNLEQWAIHGTVFYAEGEVKQSAKNKLEIRHQTTDSWISPGEIVQEWQIGDDYLFTSIEIRTFAKSFPASCGWHPWFLRELGRGKPAQYKVEATKKYQRGTDYLPTGKLVEVGSGPFDDALVVPSGKASILWPEALEIKVETNCETYVLYDLPEDSFCLEPSSGYPDQINRDPLIVTKENPLRIESTWRARLL